MPIYGLITGLGRDYELAQPNYLATPVGKETVTATNNPPDHTERGQFRPKGGAVTKRSKGVETVCLTTNICSASL